MDDKGNANAQGIRFSQLHALDFIDINGDGLKDIVTGKRWMAHGSHGDAEPMAAPVLYWFELKRTGGKVEWIGHQIDDNSGVGTQVTTDDQLLARYPRGTSRADIIHRIGAPDKAAQLVDSQNQPPIVKYHLKQMTLRLGPPPVSYDIFSVIGGDLWLGPGGASVFLD